MDIIGDTFTEDHDKVFAKVFDDILGGNVPEVPNVDHAVRDFDLDTTTCHGVQNSLDNCHYDRQGRWCRGGVAAVCAVVFAMSVHPHQAVVAVLGATADLGGQGLRTHVKVDLPGRPSGRSPGPAAGWWLPLLLGRLRCRLWLGRLCCRLWLRPLGCRLWHRSRRLLHLWRRLALIQVKRDMASGRCPARCRPCRGGRCRGRPRCGEVWRCRRPGVSSRARR